MKKNKLLFTLFVFMFSFLKINSKYLNSSLYIKESKNYVFEYTGFIGKYPISMKLNISEKPNGNVYFSGYYYYNKIGAKIQLNGSWIMRPGTATYIELNEIVNGNYTGAFSLLPNTYGDYSRLDGTWSGNGKNLKVNLNRIR